MLKSKGDKRTAHRIVTIVATGRKTATPSPYWWLRDDAKKHEVEELLEQAMNFIRRTGPTVCSAYIKFPGEDGICVDHRILTVEEFMALAYLKGFVKR